jgi:formate dehydrogenase major subunit/formate dehydrogenase alpha subunit
MADAKEVTVIIDGVPVKVPANTYVWDACRIVGQEIPNFCYIPGLRAFGACRMCVVEVSGRRGFDLVTSCSTPVTDGMEVRTINERIWQQRNMVMEALDTDHPVDCPICEANGDCRLQDYGYEYGVTGTDTRRPKVVRPSERLSPAIDIDRDRCVMCGRCVRECDETIGATALAIVERGLESLIDAPFGKSLLETPCVSCGQCVELCPVGALSSRLYSSRMTVEHHWWQRKTETTCNSCSVGCTIKLGSTRNQIWEVRSDDALGLNDGRTCVKGRFGQDYINSNDRLSTPLIRREGKLVMATWDEALDYVASRLNEYKGQLGVVASPKITNEENYALQKVARLGLGTNNVDYDGRSHEAPALEVLREMLGYAAPTNNFIDTRQKPGCILTIGDSIYETHPVYAYQLQRMSRLMGKKLIVISPRWTKMCDWSTLWLAPHAGTEELLVNGIARAILDAGLIDQAAVEAKADNVAGYIEGLRGNNLSLEAVSSVTGVDAKDIMAAAYLYATGGLEVGPQPLESRTHPSNLPLMMLAAGGDVASGNGQGRGTDTDTTTSDGRLNYVVNKPERGFPPSTIVFSAHGPYTVTPRTVAALTNLALATGNVGREGGGVNPLVADTNCLGANDVGAQPDYFPGYRPVNADNARVMEELWTANMDRKAPEVPSEPGMDLLGMLNAADTGDIKAMWVVGANPVLTVESWDSGRVRSALEKLDFLVVQDIFMNETGELADVILPASSYAEKEGTFTNAERRVQRVRQSIEPVGVSKPDLTIISGIGERLGVPMPGLDPLNVFAEIARVVPQYAGMSYSRLDMTEFIDDAIPMPAAVSYKQLKVKSLMWPCTDRLSPGTPVLYTNGFATSNGKARMWTERQQGTTASSYTSASTETQPAGGTLLATVGFGLFPFKTGTLSRHSYGLSRVEPTPRLHVNPADAGPLGIQDEMPVLVTADGIEEAEPIYAVALVYDRIPRGRAFLAFTLEQYGTNATVRQLRHRIASDTTGGRKSVALRVQPAPNRTLDSMREFQPVATTNVLDTRIQPL